MLKKWCVFLRFICLRLFNFGLSVGPGFTVKPPPFAAFRKNQRLSVTCGAYGNPKPSVTWSKNGRSVSTGVSGTLNEKTLVITSLNTGHQGNYTCTAANDIGDSVTTIVFIGKLTQLTFYVFRNYKTKQA